MYMFYFKKVKFPRRQIIDDGHDNKAVSPLVTTMTQDQIRLLGISGSPRLASTDFVIREALKYAEEKYNALTDYFSVAKKTIMFWR